MPGINEYIEVLIKEEDLEKAESSLKIGIWEDPCEVDERIYNLFSVLRFAIEDIISREKAINNGDKQAASLLEERLRSYGIKISNNKNYDNYSFKINMSTRRA